MTQQKSVIKTLNNEGYTLKHFGRWNENKFGKTNIIKVEKGNMEITFITNSLHGRNYFKIFQVHNNLTNRTYKAERFFLKYVSEINQLNGKLFQVYKNELRECTQ